jgi:hypothetical protein
VSNKILLKLANLINNGSFLRYLIVKITNTVSRESYFTFKILTDMRFIAEDFGKKSKQTFQGANLIFSPT